MYKEALEKSGRFDFYVAPSELRNYSILDPEKAEEIYQLGYSETKSLLRSTGIKERFFPDQK